jgi:hypothetical protein
MKKELEHVGSKINSWHYSLTLDALYLGHPGLSLN